MNPSQTGNRKKWLMAGAIGLAGAAVIAERKMLAKTRSATCVPARHEGGLPQAGIRDTLAILLDIFIPTIAKGVIIRRPKVVGMAERLDLDRKAIRCMQHMRRRYGGGPLMLRLPFRSQAVILAPAHVHRVLDQSPDPFSPRQQ